MRGLLGFLNNHTHIDQKLKISYQISFDNLEECHEKTIKDCIVVITGASSGIGRATALELAHRGATLVLSARREEARDELVRECIEQGIQALAAPADVTDEAAVKVIARKAKEKFGKLDVWINDAAVSLFGRFEETPPEAYRKVIETNLFGYVHGARAALPIFREQGKCILINFASVEGRWKRNIFRIVPRLPAKEMYSNQCRVTVRSAAVGMQTMLKSPCHLVPYSDLLYWA